MKMKSAIESLPKVELHYHLDGGLRPFTVRALASEAGIALPEQEEQLLWMLRVTDHCASLFEYLEKFQLPAALLQTAANLERVAYEAVEDAAKGNVKYIEIRFAPQLHVEQGLTLAETVSAVLTGMRAGEQATGTIARLILICLRNHSIELNWQVLEQASAFYGQGVVGMDLAGDEAGFPPELHQAVFEEAHRRGIPITIHAGEAAGAENIRTSIACLHASRIGHGVRLEQDPALVEVVREQRIALEMCLTSNIQTKASPSWDAHPVRRYYDQDLTVTVNTDNATVSNTTLNMEYERLMHYHDFRIDELKRMNANAIEVCFAEEEVKRKLMREFFANPDQEHKDTE
ncbi:adenosine deaminase [Paenibacillus guangzhouensis]|uniref:adenosine deaminase n=1 Tax=Paenibacillus guangzhouensis TaxID=1473112 RepID=UPI001266CCAC|nr:adenosine deaminase [Paenibacillus guangzhouensis]